MGEKANVPNPEVEPPSPPLQEAGCLGPAADHEQAIAARQPGGGGAPGTGEPDGGGDE